VSDDEVFARLIYYARVQLMFSEEEFWTMPIGEFLDYWTAHKQFHGIEKPKRQVFIDDIIPI